MTEILRVADASSYLAATGWSRLEETWRGADIWDHDGGFQVFVPSADGSRDAVMWTKELLRELAEVENRSPEDIAEDVQAVLVDRQSFRMRPDRPSGQIGLLEADRALHGIQELFKAAARATVEEPKVMFTGHAEGPAKEVLSNVILGPTRPGSYIWQTQLPVAPPAQVSLFGEPSGSLGRSVVQCLRQAVKATREAVHAVMVERVEPDIAFGGIVGDGVSSHLLDALSDLTGMDRGRPFDIGFAWARGVPGEGGAENVAFPPASGKLLSKMADNFRRLAEGVEVEVTGRVGQLRNTPPNHPWQITVEGEVRPLGDVPLEFKRVPWCRLDPEDYSVALRIHDVDGRVRVVGELRWEGQRLEIRVRRGGLTGV